MHALRVLEFDSILEQLAFHCETPIGAGLAVDLKPSFDPPEVWELLDRAREAMDTRAPWWRAQGLRALEAAGAATPEEIAEAAALEHSLGVEL